MQQPGRPGRDAWHAGITLGGPDPFRAADAVEVGGAHQPGDLVAADVAAGAAGGLHSFRAP